VLGGAARHDRLSSCRVLPLDEQLDLRMSSPWPPVVPLRVHSTYCRGPDLKRVARATIAVDLGLAGELKRSAPGRVVADVDVALALSRPNRTCSLTQPEILHLTLQLPLRRSLPRRALRPRDRRSSAAQIGAYAEKRWSANISRPQDGCPSRLDLTPEHSHSPKYASTRPFDRPTAHAYALSTGTARTRPPPLSLSPTQYAPGWSSAAQYLRA